MLDGRERHVEVTVESPEHCSRASGSSLSRLGLLSFVFASF